MTLEPAEVRARYDELISAWGRHDLVAVQAMHAPDVELVIDGTHELAGRYTGSGSVLAALVKFAPYVQAGDPHEDKVEVRAGEIETASTVTIRSPLMRKEGRTLFRTTIRFSDDGHVVHVWNRADDQAALDGFFGVLDAERR